MCNGSGNVGRGRKGGCWIIVLIFVKIIMIPPGLIIFLGKRVVINSLNGFFLRKVAIFHSDVYLYIP